MVNKMEMYFLIMTTYIDKSAVVMPEKYSLEQCEKAGRTIETISGYHFKCVPAPVKTCVMRVRPVPSMPQVMENYKECE